jgi:hypothetical protein
VASSSPHFRLFCPSAEVVAGFRPLLWPAKDSGLVQAVEATKKATLLGRSQRDIVKDWTTMIVSTL